MKLATLKHPKKRDGVPLLVHRNNQTAVRIDDLAPSLRELLETWSDHESALQSRFESLTAGRLPAATQLDESGLAKSSTESFAVDETRLHSPLPRSFQWADGSAYVQHIKLVRQARNAPLPETLLTVPLMYQGGSDTFLTPREDIPLINIEHGLDFEGEVAVVTGDVPMGVTADDALKYIRLFLLVNDVSLRGLIPEELAQGFGFFQSKPSTAFAPFAVTVDELGGHFKNGRVNLPLLSEYNGKFFGNPNASEMQFHFGQLIAHAARTRKLSAGTIIRERYGFERRY